HEVVVVQQVDYKNNFSRGRVEQAETPYPHRSYPRSMHFTVFSGCHYQHIPYQAQLQYKAEILRETLGRIGRVEWGGPIETHASPPFGYRNRAQWKVRPAGPGGRSEEHTSELQSR